MKDGVSTAGKVDIAVWTVRNKMLLIISVSILY